MARGRLRKRWPILATAAVLVAGTAGATTVFLVGSSQRRDDRAAYLRYERAVLVPIRAGGQLVQQEMKPSLGDLGSGSLSAALAVLRAGAWRSALTRTRNEISAIRAPRFLGDIVRLWSVAMDGYLKIPDLFAQAARAAGAKRTALLDAAAEAGNRADKLFDDAARVMQYHRRRLGLGPTHDLPDPGARG